MRRHYRIAALALALGAAPVFAQTAGVPPPVPAVQSKPIPSQSNDIGGQQGFFAPPRTDAVVVPAFTPTTPGVTPNDTPTNATVGSSTADRTLRDSVASAIAGDPSLAGARINVTVSNGVVNLTGAARDQNQADRARAIAEGVAGAARVNASVSTSG